MDLILLHGALGAKDQLIPLSESLKNKFRIHLLNFSGHGGLPFPADFSIPVFADDLHKYIVHNRLEHPAIFGYSMGGYVALYLARHHPGVTGPIYTLGTKFDWNSESAEKESAMLDPQKILEKAPHYAETLAKRHARQDWKMVNKMTAKMMIELGKENALNAEDFHEITNRVVIGLGEDDKMADKATSEWVAKQIPNAGFALLADTPHPIEKVNISLLSRFLIGFFN